MKIKLLPSTFDERGRSRPEQRLTCYLVDDRVALDAGSLALALTDPQRAAVRDVVVTHPHMDHVATLPIFIDDLFSQLTSPVRVHATDEVCEMLRGDLFNGTLYPRFHELENEHGRVLEFAPFETGQEFGVAHLRLTAVPVHHAVPTVGLVVSDGGATVAFSSDTSQTEEFWSALDRLPRLDALCVESSFPNSMRELARVSGHLTPETLAAELSKLSRAPAEILVVHIKPSFRETILAELEALEIANLSAMETGRVYEW
ncbi:MAG: 3',5'-cyclic-nucleotide phosphodiesterase [Acidobacteria bacterium]|nr:3',5'-cyclic-nucleotide phosphodiesterase [Acidobacteriota bacterium]MCA1643490.1 3',5'-cyclic-nucleotide phosphodiesterase [Acidobacteriota bacterium]